METYLLWMYMLFVTILLYIEPSYLCPSDEGCVCHGGDMYCDGQDHNSVPKFSAVNRTYNVLDMGRNRIKKIKANAFKNLKVKKIKIRQNSAPLEVNRKAFKGLEDILETLHITRSHVKSLPPSLFKLVAISNLIISLFLINLAFKILLFQSNIKGQGLSKSQF